jgi:hypothetical protein
MFCDEPMRSKNRLYSLYIAQSLAGPELLIDEYDFGRICFADDLRGVGRHYDVRSALAKYSHRLALNVWMKIYFWFIDDKEGCPSAVDNMSEQLAPDLKS